MTMIYVLGILAGGVLGAFWGSRQSCASGSCPLTSSPYIGGLYGGLMGFLLVSAAFGMTRGASAQRDAAQEDTTMSTANSSVVEIKNSADFEKEVVEAPVPVLIDLWATWCAPCRAQMPIVEQVASKAGDKARVAKVNIDDVPEIAERLRVNAIPTLVVYKDGKEAQRFVGMQSADTLARAVGL